MLIRTNSILKLDIPFTEIATQGTVHDADSVKTSISTVNLISTKVDNSDSIQRDINDDIKAKKKKNDIESAMVLAPNKRGSSFICRTDQEEDGERGVTQAQTTSFPCSSSSYESIYSKATITSCLGIHHYASTNCNDADHALIEQRASYHGGDDDNEQGAEEQLSGDWMIQDAADSDAADHVDQGSFVSSVNLNQQRYIDDDSMNSTNSSKQQQQEEWFKGTSFYVDPGTAPILPPKDYISINNFIDLEDHKKLYDQGIHSECHQPIPPPSLYSLAISTKIRSSIKNRQRTITGKVRNALTKRKSFFSRA